MDVLILSTYPLSVVPIYTYFKIIFMTKEKANEEFCKWYRRLPHGEYRKFRDSIITECEISRTVFYNWMSSKSKISKANQRVIESVAGKQIFLNQLNENV